MIGRALRQHWMVVVAAAVVALAAFGVHRFHGMFAAGFSPKTPGGGADQIVPFNPKNVTLEVYGDPGATATITYMDVDSRPQHADDVALPWTYDGSTTTPAVLLNLQAQGSGSTLGCRITVDGVVKVERVSDGASAYVFCLDKSG